MTVMAGTKTVQMLDRRRHRMMLPTNRLWTQSERSGDRPTEQLRDCRILFVM